jgi:tetratricopeptide (TPR) repeat protein/serine/threonine protein kinase
MTATPCPTREELAALLAGRLSGDSLAAVAGHLDSCPQCQSLAASLEAGSDPLLSALRRLPTGDAFLAEPQCQEAVARFQKVPAPAPGSTTHDPATPPPVEAGAPSSSTEKHFHAEVRYRQVRFHARGGLGEVHVAHDEDLHREVALKNIQDRWAHDPESRRRFLLEAEITGRLEHPGIVPVYGLVQGADGRPCYAMRFIQGETLKAAAERFHQADHPGRDVGERQLALRQLLARFVAVCNTMAYAHSRGVIHRDLKPANVMLGRYGETLVVDWGLAKPVGRDETARAGDEDTLAPSSGADSGGTQLGKAVGTPAFMSPEQAAGRWDLVGPASDIYSLGATLYFLLTGRPPFERQAAANAVAALLERVKHGEFSRPRKVKANIPAALEAVCLKAMAHQPEARYRTALELAADVEHWLGGEPVTAYPEPWTVRTGRWIRRHRTLVTATAAALLAGLVLGGALWWQLDQEREERRVEAAIRETRAREAVEATLTQVAELQRKARWEEAKAALRQAFSRLGPEGMDDLRRRLDQAQKNLDFVRILDTIRLERFTLVEGKGGYSKVAPAYAKAFPKFGLNVLEGEVEEWPKRIAASAIKEQLVAALDDWALAAGFAQNGPTQKRLFAIARRADPEPWRDQLRDLAVWKDQKALQRLADRLKDKQQPPTLVAILGQLLEQWKADGLSLLYQAHQQQPGDFWLNILMGYALQRRSHWNEAIGYYHAALALRPQSAAVYAELGNVLFGKGDLDGAIAQYNKALVLEPKLARAHSNLASALKHKRDLKGAIAEHHKAIALDPKDAGIHVNLGAFLCDVKHDYDGAITEFKKAIALRPKDAAAHSNLGNALRAKGDLDGAIAEFKTAIALDPKFASAHHNLGFALNEKGNQGGAIAEYKKAIALDPKLSNAYINLGYALRARGDLDGAIAACNKAIALVPKDAKALNNLGLALQGKGDLDGAIAAYRKAIALDPKDALAHYNLGIILTAKGDIRGAINAYRGAIKLKPNFAEAHCNLGDALMWDGQLAEALISKKRGHKLGTLRQNWQYPSAQSVKKCEQLVNLDGKLSKFLQGEIQPKDIDEYLALADLLRIKRRYADAARFFADAFGAKPELADNLHGHYRYNAACIAARAAAGKGEGATKLSDNERARWRKQTHGWLKADLKLWTEILKKGTPQGRMGVQQMLQHWQNDTDLVTVRDAMALVNLPQEERQAWTKLWADVDTLLKRAQAKK